MYKDEQNKQNEKTNEVEHNAQSAPVEHVEPAQVVEVQRVERQIVQMPEERHYMPKTEGELEKISPQFRYYKLVYIIAAGVVELVILALTFLSFPWAAFGIWTNWASSSMLDLTWVSVLVIGNLISWLVFSFIRRAYDYLALGKKFW